MAILLVMLAVAAGEGFAGETRIGLHGGLSIPDIRGGTTEQSTGYTSRLGPFFGLFYDFPVRPRFALRAEVNYVGQGGKRNGMQPISADQVSGLPVPPDVTLYADFRNETILDYVEIPLMVRLNWQRRPRFYVGAGPYIGFLIRARTVTGGTSSLYADASGTPLLIGGEPVPAVSFDGHTDIKQDVNSRNAGIAGGVGLESPFGAGAFSVDAHFSLGLSNIEKDPAQNGENHTGAVVVAIGYSHPL